MISANKPGATHYKTRLAPTPSGYLHLGNVLSFAITMAVAEQHGAKVMLRIDDYDRERLRPPYVQDVFDTLAFLGMRHHEGPKDAAQFEALYACRHRRALYEEAVQKLQTEGRLFACTCSRADVLKASADGNYPGTCQNKGLSLNTPGSALRLRTPDVVNIMVHTPDGAVQVHALPPSVRHFVVQKRDGGPAYQLCSVVDDVHYGNNLIVRGQDLWDSTLAQLYLSQVLGLPLFEQAVFMHHPLLLQGDKKLSKSEGATSVHRLRKEGKSAAEVYSAVAGLMGINKKVETWQALAAVLSSRL